MTVHVIAESQQWIIECFRMFKFSEQVSNLMKAIENHYYLS